MIPACDGQTSKLCWRAVNNDEEDKGCLPYNDFILLAWWQECGLAYKKSLSISTWNLCFLDQELISHIATHLVVVVLLLVGQTFQKSLKLCRFRSDREEIWRNCSSRKYMSIDYVVRFWMWSRTSFKMSSVTSFQAEKCCHLVRAYEASAAASGSSSFIVHL